MDMDIEIRKIDGLKNETIRVNIAFNTPNFGPIVIKGFRVGKSPKFEDLWIQPPCFNVYGKYHKMCFFEKTDVWEAIEALLADVYIEYEANPNNIDVAKISSEIGGDAL